MIILETKRDDFYVQIYGPNQRPIGPAAAIPSLALASYVTDLIGSEDALTLAGNGVKRALTGMGKTLVPRLNWQVSAISRCPGSRTVGGGRGGVRSIAGNAQSVLSSPT